MFQMAEKYSDIYVEAFAKIHINILKYIDFILNNSKKSKGKF